MQNDKKIEESPKVCEKVLEIVGKPDNYFMSKGLNVYDNKYRVNIYTKESIDGLTGEKTRIAQSYFCRLDDEKVTILS